jgi:hypothetical protein
VQLFFTALFVYAVHSNVHFRAVVCISLRDITPDRWIYRDIYVICITAAVYNWQIKSRINCAICSCNLLPYQTMWLFYILLIHELLRWYTLLTRPLTFDVSSVSMSYVGRQPLGCFNQTLEVRMEYCAKRRMRIHINTPKIYDEIFTTESVFISLCLRNKPHFRRTIFEVRSSCIHIKICNNIYLSIPYGIGLSICVPLHDKTELQSFNL